MIERAVLRGVVSTVVELEVLVKPLRERNVAAWNQAERLFQGTPNLAVRVVDRSVAYRAADVRARTGLSVPDAIIVATALEERCDALIGNDARIASRDTGVSYLYLDDYVSRG
jgi:predicted nucleic acid-binding protein